MRLNLQPHLYIMFNISTSTIWSNVFFLWFIDRCKHGDEDQSEWYFFSYKDRKYSSGTRTNRATASGFWKATGRDKPVLSNSKIIGMRKTLVFYKGRAPNGRKSDWIMHEYRLQTNEHAPPQVSQFYFHQIKIKLGRKVQLRFSFVFSFK